MLQALIVDDEQHCIDRLKLLFENHKHNIGNYKICHSVSQAKSILENYNIDVLFLDVQLQNEMGFDLLKQLNTINFEIIFTTAYDSYAVEAFKFSALDYLLKPIDNDDLTLAMDKLKERKTLLNSAKKVASLLHNLNKNNDNKVINLSNSEGLHIIKVKEIIRCQADGNYTHLYLQNDKRITVSKTLKYFENLLKSYLFFRIHQSHLINLLYLNQFNQKKRVVKLNDGSEIEVSIRKKEPLLRILNDMKNF